MMASTKNCDGANTTNALLQASGDTRQPSAAPLSLRDGERAALRPAVARVEGDVLLLEAQHDLDGFAQAAGQLAASWRGLVSLMALGAAPELRACPHCGYRILLLATRCVNCWKQSEAPA